MTGSLLTSVALYHLCIQQDLNPLVSDNNTTGRLPFFRHKQDGTAQIKLFHLVKPWAKYCAYNIESNPANVWGNKWMKVMVSCFSETNALSIGSVTISCRLHDKLNAWNFIMGVFIPLLGGISPVFGYRGAAQDMKTWHCSGQKNT